MIATAFTLAATLVLAPQDAVAPAPVAASATAPAVDPAARALWDAVVAAAAGKTTARATAFVFEFEATRYSGENQSNDVDATYSYLEPGWVRVALVSGRQRLRGPDGDWLIDKAGATRLVGRDFKQDFAELNETVAVARTFAHLTDPRGLHLESLARMAAPPQGLPEKLRAGAAALDWLRLESRDFRAPPQERAGKAPEPGPIDVLELGVERATRVPRMAVLTDPSAHANAIALGLEGSVEVDGFRVPERVTAWKIDVARTPPAFGARQTLDLWFKSGTLAPKLSREDFLPPR
jgi:hypothetical protein